MNYQNLLCYDFETISSGSNLAYDPQVAEPCQLSALIIDGRKLEVIPNSRFTSFIKPPFPAEEMNREVLEWHAKIRKISTAEVLDIFYKAPSQETVWNDFKNYIKKYHSGTGNKTIFNAPIRTGANVVGFDNIIFDRLCVRYKMVGKDGKQNLVMGNRAVDSLFLLWPWLENNPDINKLSMDELRPYFGFNTEGSHDAEKDVEDTAAIIIRFLKLTRNLAAKYQFAGAFAK